jgi:hypothetical protein
MIIDYFRSLKPIYSEGRMVRFKSAILFVALTVLVSCSVQRERPEEQEAKPGEQKEEKQPASFPTFRYRPGAGLTIEGRKREKRMVFIAFLVKAETRTLEESGFSASLI